MKVIMEHAHSIPQASEIVIIGGGIIGLSVAFHLAGRGATDVTVVERGSVASGATAYATGGIRQQFSSKADILLSRESVSFFEDFEARVGYPLLFRQKGYLFILTDEVQLKTFEQSAHTQNALGVPTQVLSADEVKSRYPVINTSDVVGATFCPTDGSAAPADAAYAFASRCRDSGIRLIEDTEVRGIETDNQRITAVTTEHGRISTSTVINAAGPWARIVGEMAGVTVPVNAHPRQVFTLTAMDALGDDFPFTVDLSTGVYVHQEPGSIVVGGGDRDRESSYEATQDWSRFPGVVEAVTHRVPILEDAGGISGWCGLREMTPDDHSILGPVTEPHGFWNAVGFSGHGFMHAPAVGRIMAEWVLAGTPPNVDVSPFALDRFDVGDVSSERVVF